MDKPSVGRSVHYVVESSPGGAGGVCRAAIITEVDAPPGQPSLATDRIGLCAINPNELVFHQRVPYNENDKTPGTWHWPERVS